MHEGFLLASKLAPILVFPFSVALLLLALSLLPRLRPPRRSALAGCALAVLLVGSCAPLGRELGRSLEWRYLPPAELPQLDAIVLLGGATVAAIPPRRHVEVNEAGDRIFQAARLYRDGRAPRIVVSGGRFDGSRTLGPESDEMAGLLQELGVPDAAILRESVSRNTYENAVETHRLLAALGANRILLVTSALHMPRAVGLFRHQGFEVVPVPVDFDVTEETPSDYGAWFPLLSKLLPQAESLTYTTRVLREYLGLFVYRMRGLID